jgi:hypothetical protein
MTGLLASVHQVAAQVSYAPAVNYAEGATGFLGSQPQSLVAADVYGDFKLSLVCANFTGTSYASTLTVLTNYGNGIFGSNVSLTVGPNPRSVVAADINGDGKADLITANLFGTLTVLTNGGGGMFGSNATYTVAGNPTAVVAADVTGDGKLDLVCVSSPNLLTVLTNNGSGLFKTNGIYSVGTDLVSVAVADINGDGKADLICVSGGDATSIGALYILTNNGSGVFGSNATLIVGSSPESVTVTDVNGDHKPDLVSANYDDNTLTVLTNNGSGVFGFNATLDVGSGPFSVVSTDCDGDGNMDLICLNRHDGTLTVLTNNGCGVFGLNATLNAGIFPYQVIAADVNGDGKPDLISIDAISCTASVFINTSIFSPPASSPRLAIKRSDNGLVVSWPSASPGWSLQENWHLTKPRWLPSGYAGFAITDDGTNKSLSLPLAVNNLYFHLLHP